MAPIRQPTTPTSHTSNVQVTLVIPDYRAKHDAAKAIAPQTQYVALLLNGTEHDELALTDGVTTPYTPQLSSTWTGTFADVPVDTYAAGEITIQVRDSSHGAVTAGSNTSSVQVIENTTTSGIEVHCLPVAATALSAGIPMSGSVGLNSMTFYSLTGDASINYTVTLEVISGEPDLYVFDPLGVPVASDTSTTAPTVLPYDPSSTGTHYLGVYGYSAAQYKVTFDIAGISAPTGLQASQDVYTNKVHVAWTAITGVDGYNLYRSDSEPGTYTKLNTSLLTAASYDDTTITQNTPYFYKVDAVDGAIVSDQTAAEQGSSISAIAYLVGVLETAGQEKYYSFPAEAGKTYYVQWDDSFSGSGTYTGDLRVSAYLNDVSTSYLFDSWQGYTTPKSITPGASTIYIKIRGYDSTVTGTYAIRVYTVVRNIALTEETGSIEGLVY